MGLAFSNDTVHFEDQALCCVPVRLLKVEDSTYNMQMLGSDCMTMEQVKRHREKIYGKASSIVGKVIWDFIQTINYIFPVLHFEIGTFNIILDSFYCFVEDQIEILPEDKKFLWM
jgi:hypothetical protein